MIMKDILANLYINEHRTIKDVANVLNINPYWVGKYLKIHNIPIRKKGYGFNVKPRMIFSKEQYEFFDGLIISDGSICKKIINKNTRCSGNSFISCAFKHKEFADYIINYLNLGVISKLKISKSPRYKSGEVRSYFF